MGAIAFASSNIDDIFVLLGFFADPKLRRRAIVLGQYLGIGALYGASVLLSLVSLVLDTAYLELLGVVPIAIGVRQLMELSSAYERRESELLRHPNSSDAVNQCLTVAGVTLANGADNLAIYTPLFATQSGHNIAVMGAMFVLMTALWCGFARWLVIHPTLGAPIRRYGHQVTPSALIALGLIILLR
jgi:cadmium resistance protein CadD (predicted permease)